MVQPLVVFISYSRDDTEIAHEITRVLEKGGHKPWIDEQLILGQRWKDKLKQAIDECDAFLILLSPATLESEWCQWEYAEALSQNKPIFPVVIEAIAKPLPPAFEGLSDIQYLNITGGITATNSAALVGGIFQAQPLPRTPDTEKPEPPPPELESNMRASMTLTDRDAVTAIDVTEPHTRLPVPNQNPLPRGIKARLTIGHNRTPDTTEKPVHMTMFTIGRSPNMDLPIPERRVSKHHLSIYWGNGRFFLVDYSLNGTWLNGERIQNNRPVALDDDFEHRIDLARTDTYLNFLYTSENSD